MAKSAAEQARALHESMGVRVRRDLVVVNVRGEDAVSWLNGQVTNDVRELAPDEGRYALAVTVRGKIMADLWVIHRAEGLAVLLPERAVAAVLESFEQQIIMEDVELVRDAGTRVIAIQGPRADEVFGEHDRLERHRCDELGSGGLFALVAEPQLEACLLALNARAETLGGAVIDEAGWELARLRAGRGRFAADFGEQNYPQEAGLKALAVSFSKGCYLGQEVVCTLENRGRLNRRLMRLESAAHELAVGAELLDAEGHVVGQITSRAADPESGQMLALGYVKHARAQVGAQLKSGAAEIRVVAPAGAD